MGKIYLTCGVKDCTYMTSVTNSKLDLRHPLSLSELATVKDKNAKTTLRFWMRKHYNTEHNEIAYPREIEKRVAKGKRAPDSSEELPEQEEDDSDSDSRSAGKEPGIPSRSAGSIPGIPVILFPLQPSAEWKKTIKWAELPKVMEPFCSSVERSIKRRVEIMPEMDKQSKLVNDKFTSALAAIKPAMDEMEMEIQVFMNAPPYT